MATFADLTVDGNDIAGVDFDPSRASAVIEFGGDDGVIEAIVVDSTTFRLGSRREKPGPDGIITFADLVTTNSASNPTTFFYRVRFTYVPKGSRKQGHDEWVSGWFPLTGDANLAAIPEAWDNVTAPVSWRSDFRDEMETLLATTQAVAGADTADDLIAAIDLDAGSTFRTQQDARQAAKINDLAVVVRDAPLAPYRYGFDPIAANNAPALNAMLAAAPDGSEVYLPHAGDASITSPLSITKPVSIRASSAYAARIRAVNCNAVNVAEGVDNVQIRNVELLASTRYTTTPHNYVGINVAGVDANRPRNHVYEDVFCDGFKTAHLSHYLWASNFERLRVQNGLTGITAYGLSVNNLVHGGSIIVNAAAGSRGIQLLGRVSATDATPAALEGWTITDNVIFGAEINIEGQGATNVYVANNIIDYCDVLGINIADMGGTGLGGIWTIVNNYIAMSGTAATAAIRVTNTVSNPRNDGCDISGNQIIVYVGSACATGIYASGSQAGGNLISRNRVRGFTTNDIRTTPGGNTIRGNVCRSVVTNNILPSSTGADLIADNVGTVFRHGSTADIAPYRRDSLGRKVALATAAPTAGTWAVGDRVQHAVPAVGSPKGWTCTVAGTPGTWVSEGNL